MAIAKFAEGVAAPPPAFGTATTDAGLRDEIKTELVRKLLLGVPMAFGLGAGMRGLMGISPLVSRHTGTNERNLPSRTSMLHVMAPEHLTPPPARKRLKQAAGPGPVGTAAAAPAPLPATPTPPVGWGAAAALAKATGMLNPTGKDRGWAGWLAGDAASRGSHIPVSAALPLGLPLAMAGGYSMTDWILNRTRKKELDSEVDNAKRDYEQALYDLGSGDNVKTSSEQACPELDTLARTYVEKTAAQEKTAIWDTAGLIGALALTGGGATAMLTGKATYDFLRSRDEAKVLNEAFRRRQQQLFAQAPFPTMAVLDRPAPKKQPTEQEPKATSGE